LTPVFYGEKYVEHHSAQATQTLFPSTHFDGRLIEEAFTPLSPTSTKAQPL